LLSVFGGFCLVFILMLAAIIWIFVVPHRKKQVEGQERQEQAELSPAPVTEPAPAPATATEPVAIVEEPITPAINVVPPDMKEDINALVSDNEPITEPQKPQITEVINAEPVEKEQERKEEITPEKEEIKIDLNQVELTEEITLEAPQEAKPEMKEEKESAVSTPPKEPPEGSQPTA
jgi:hypothetical protein